MPASTRSRRRSSPGRPTAYDSRGPRRDGRSARRAAAGLANAEIARVLRELADLLEVEGGNVFRVRAYRGAARTVEELPSSVRDAGADGTAMLEGLPGIGEDLREKILQLARTGSLPLLRELRHAAPPGVVELMRVRGIGPHRARVLAERLGVRSLAGLARAARAGRVRELPGFGARTEQVILRELGAQREEEHRTLRATAMQYADEVVEHLRALPAVERVELAGSLRRCRETVGDLDVLACSAEPGAVVARFVSLPGVATVLAQGVTRAAIRLRSGVRVDLRVLDRESFGAALHYFTGSKAHNIAIRALGRRRGLLINEYGVHRRGRRIGGREEQDVFDAVGLPWIPPELREARGEIEAAAAGTLPRLLTLEDVRGDLQMHTTDSDGRDALAAMAHAAEAMGYEYVAITDHSPAVRVAGGLDAAGFRRQWKRIDRLNAQLRHLTILRGVEVDVHADGSLDLDDRTLAGFDLVLASIHSHFDLPRESQTARLLRAITHPSVRVIAHPTGRLIGRRAGVALDLAAVFRAAADHGVALEVNAQPQRLDLDDVAARQAVEAGVTLSLGTDAHAVAELRFMRWGVDQARRAWVARGNVLNARSLERLLRALARD